MNYCLCGLFERGLNRAQVRLAIADGRINMQDTRPVSEQLDIVLCTQ